MELLGGILALVGLVTMVVGGWGLLRGRVRWAHLATRGASGTALAAGFAVTLVAGAAAPSTDVPVTTIAVPVTTARAAPTTTTSSTTASTTTTTSTTSSTSTSTSTTSTVVRTTTTTAVTAPPTSAAVVTTTPPATAGTRTTSATLDCPDGTYINAAGNEVCRPYASSTPPPGATARCRNGEYSFSQTPRGTCSGNGGVAERF